MAKKIYILFISLLLIPFISYGQCDGKSGVFKCAQFFGDTIVYLNDFKIAEPRRKSKESPNGKEFDLYLMRNTEYRFVICCESFKPIVMKLYNDTVPESTPYRTTYIDKKDHKYFDFICKKSGVYKVSIRFKDENLMDKELDAIGIIGFIRKVK